MEAAELNKWFDGSKNEAKGVISEGGSGRADQDEVDDEEEVSSVTDLEIKSE